MDQKVEIKPEPDWFEGTASTSFENFEFVSANSHLKEEPNPELMQPGATQLAADIKDEIIIPEQTVDQLDTLPKEEVRSFDINVPKSVKSSTLTKTGARPHVCIECGKTYSGKSKLEQHSAIHTRERPHICIQCGKTFSDNSTLKRHSIIHTGERPHVCNLCGKAFSQVSNLKRHALIHTGDRPYVCMQCGKTFSQKSRFEQHTFINHGVR